MLEPTMHLEEWDAMALIVACGHINKRELNDWSRKFVNHMECIALMNCAITDKQHDKLLSILTGHGIEVDSPRDNARITQRLKQWQERPEEEQELPQFTGSLGLSM